MDGHCVEPIFRLRIVITILHVAIDIVIAILPISLIWKFDEIKMTEKLMMSGILALGGLYAFPLSFGNLSSTSSNV